VFGFPALTAYPRRRQGLAGRTRWRRLIGTGLLYNVHYAGLTISPRGLLYTGVLGGTVALADG
jgi:hypothetical protein